MNAARPMSDVLAAVKPRPVPDFPAERVVLELQQALVAASRSLAKRKGFELPPLDSDLVALSQEIDSLSVVELLSKLDELLPFKVTECVVKPGGYGSIASAIDDVTRRVKKKWEKHHAGRKR